MSRNFVALGVIALAGALLALPDPSFAGPGGFRSGTRAGGVRAPLIVHRNARAGILRTVPRAVGLPHVGASLPLTRPAAANRVFGSLARTTVRAPFARLERRHHRAYIYGSPYPITTDSDVAYIGTPYDPAEAIPVYAPPPLANLADPVPPALAPRLSGTREDNQDACRSERVIVPAAEGEREITVVRC